VVALLLKDPRVHVTLDDNMGRTPLWHASSEGNLEVIEWLIASGEDLGDIGHAKGNWDGEEYTPLEIARKENMTEAVSVLQRFIANPALTRHELRVRLGFTEALAAEVFALTVFLCDGLLQLKPAIVTTTTRFFAIAKRLPMELQMILCNFVAGSKKQNILRKGSNTKIDFNFVLFPLFFDPRKKRKPNLKNFSSFQFIHSVVVTVDAHDSYLRKSFLFSSFWLRAVVPQQLWLGSQARRWLGCFGQRFQFCLCSLSASSSLPPPLPPPLPPLRLPLALLSSLLVLNIRIQGKGGKGRN